MFVMFMIIGIVAFGVLTYCIYKIVEEIDGLKERYNKLVQYNAKLTKEIKR